MAKITRNAQALRGKLATHWSPAVRDWAVDRLGLDELETISLALRHLKGAVRMDTFLASYADTPEKQDHAEAEASRLQSLIVNLSRKLPEIRQGDRVGTPFFSWSVYGASLELPHIETYGETISVNIDTV